MGLKLIIVSGLSGSGKSVALHTLEDLGFYCIDNLPLFLLGDLARGLEGTQSPQLARTAVGIDARNQPERLTEVPALVAELKTRGVECHVIYLEARPESLIKRFSETRRKHPLTADDRSLAEAIKLERHLLAPILDIADLDRHRVGCGPGYGHALVGIIGFFAIDFAGDDQMDGRAGATAGAAGRAGE